MKLIFGANEAATSRVVFCGEQTDAAVSEGAQPGWFRRRGPEAGKVKGLETAQGLLILAGRPETEALRHVQQQLGRAVRLAREEAAGTVELDLDSWPGKLPAEQLVRAAALAAWEGNYTFQRYRTGSSPGLDAVFLKKSGGDAAVLQRAFQTGGRLGQAVSAVRDVVNRTSRDLTPEAFIEWLLERAKGRPYEVEILDEEALQRHGVDALLAVSAGAGTAPYMAILRYCGDPEHPDQVTAVLGKGITFDSGGLSLKSKKGMLTMHHDMAGAAAAAAAFDEAAQAGLPINLTAVLPVCENMLSPVGYRPGDVISTMDGKTVLIKSTDAEGRLVLADAMTWAVRKEGAGRLIDLATLTGGAVAAYGPLINAVASEDPVLRNAIQEASQTSGELVWEMPLLADYRRCLHAEHADLANSSNGAGSAMINAALFLKEFTHARPWLHIDSAATSWTDKTDGCCFYGATGAGTVLLFDLFCRLAEQ